MALCSLSPLYLSKTNNTLSLPSLRHRRPRSPVASLSVGFDDIIQLVHNKVLVAATVSATIGQLSKPFTSAIRGNGFNLKSMIQSGGMPSTHSATVVAAATSLGLERGFSDSIFGMSVVYAALVVYDSQVAAAATPETLPAQLYYWSKALPNTPMPTAIHDLLHPVDKKVSGRSSGPYSPVLEKDMLSGTDLTTDFVRPTSAFGSSFLSRQAAKSIPFSSTELPAIFARFSVDPESFEAKSIKKTIKECEAPAADGERKFCATSLESMVEYTTSALATRNVLALSTSMSNEDVPRQKYTIVPSGVKKLSGSNFVACHARRYPYAVFYCHTTIEISAYQVSTVGEDGTTVEAVAVCHDVIAGPDSYGTKFKAGESFCHLLPPDDVVWIPKN